MSELENTEPGMPRAELPPESLMAKEDIENDYEPGHLEEFYWSKL